MPSSANPRRFHARRLLLAVAGAASLSGCKFTFDRTLGTGEIRGVVVVAPSPGASPVPAVSTHVAIENSSIGVDVDSNGRFVIRGLPPGSYALDLTASLANNGKVDHGLRLTGVTLASTTQALGDGRDLGVVEIGAFGGLLGTVVKSGTPLTGAAVVLPSLRATSTFQGGFKFQNLLPGDYTVQAFAPTANGRGHLAIPVAVKVVPRVNTTIPTIDVAMAPIVTTGGLEGQARLIGVPSSQGIAIALTFFAATVMTTDAAGDYSESGVPAGLYTMTASAPGYLSAVVPGTVIGGPATQMPLVVLAPAPPNAPDAGMASPGPDAGPPPTTPTSVAGTVQSSSTNYTASTVTGQASSPSHSSQYSYTPGLLAGSLPDGGS